jgi:uncharacterized protein (PEP-CTERM system associated)
LGLRAIHLPISGLISIAAAAAHAQAVTDAPVAAGRTLEIVPTISLSETLTDNSRLSSTNRQADLITVVAPGLHVSSSGGRIKGFLDYSLQGLIYARHSANNEVQNSLNAAATAEAIEDWAFVDVRANVSQQAISAFGTQSADPHLVNDNRTEVATYLVSPYVHGRLSDIAAYDARLTYSSTRSNASEASDVTTSESSIRLAGPGTASKLGWAADASHQVFRFSEGRRNENDRLRLQLNWAIDPQLRAYVTGGREANNFVSFDKKSYTTRGGGIDWFPSERTSVSASAERRFFGNSHTFIFGHRTPRTVWSYVDSRDVSTGFGRPTLGSQGTIYDLLFIQFASLQPDPVLRAQLVNNFLQANNIPPTALLPSGSLVSAATLERRQELSFAILALRDTFTWAASQGEARRLDTLAAVNDDFANANLVTQRGLSFTWAHRLTPQSSLNLFTSVARTSGTVASPSTTLSTLNVTWTQRIGPRSAVTLGARHQTFKSPSAPYNESALTANLTYRI